jgi:hypothetical protein
MSKVTFVESLQKLTGGDKSLAAVEAFKDAADKFARNARVYRVVLKDGSVSETLTLKYYEGIGLGGRIKEAGESFYSGQVAELEVWAGGGKDFADPWTSEELMAEGNDLIADDGRVYAGILARKEPDAATRLAVAKWAIMSNKLRTDEATREEQTGLMSAEKLSGVWARWLEQYNLALKNRDRLALDAEAAAYYRPHSHPASGGAGFMLQDWEEEQRTSPRSSSSKGASGGGSSNMHAATIINNYGVVGAQSVQSSASTATGSKLPTIPGYKINPIPQLSFSWKSNISEAALSLGCMSNAGSRQGVRNALPKFIQNVIHDAPTSNPKQEVGSLLNALGNFEGGYAYFLEVIYLHDKNTYPWFAFLKVLEAAGVVEQI